MKMVIASLYRYGYELTVLAENRTQAKKALMEEYTRAFIARNECEPDKDYLSTARQDIEYTEMKLGKVEWM